MFCPLICVCFLDDFLLACMCVQLYRAFGAHPRPFLLQLASQALSDVAQRFYPEQFWTERPRLSAAMHTELERVLGAAGMRHSEQQLNAEQPIAHIEVVSFQLLRFVFLERFESTIVAIQLSIQARTTSEYRQNVVRVEKLIDIAEAHTNATITALLARASATASTLRAGGTRKGFTATQQAKALAYHSLQRAVGWSARELVQYWKMRAVRAHHSHKLVVGGSAMTRGARFGSNERVVATTHSAPVIRTVPASEHSSAAAPSPAPAPAAPVAATSLERPAADPALTVDASSASLSAAATVHATSPTHSRVERSEL
jgi:hypothetical protein